MQINKKETLTQLIPSAYDGEFFILSSFGDKVQDMNLKTSAISYNLEVVSFPFTPPNISTTGDADGSFTTRELFLPDLSNYTHVTDFNSNNSNIDGFVWQNGIFHKTTNNISFSNSDGYSYQMRTTANSFMGTVAANFQGNRSYFPVSIIKISINFHDGNSINDEIIYSIDYYIDLTRGRLKFYPWHETNTFAIDVPAYDLLIYPTIKNLPNLTHSYNTTNNTALIHPNNNGTINYFPGIYPLNASKIDYVYPEITDYSMYFDGYEPNGTYLYPAPYCLPNIELRDAKGNAYAGYNTDGTINPGIEHKYFIDKPMDLTLLNPVDKVIYNPSEAFIDINNINTPLIFPEGYTFKTINGLFPSKDMVDATDPHKLYRDRRKVNVSNSGFPNQDNQHTSEYIVESGSVLIIEPCVKLIDVTIKVKQGGYVKYDASRVYLENSSIINDDNNNPGNIVNNYDYNGNTYGSCKAECYDYTNFNQYDGNFEEIINIDQNTIWNTSNIGNFFNTSNNTVKVPGKIIIKTGNTLTINAGLKFEFSETGKIIIEKGAKLIVNGQSGNEVTFTSACDYVMWNGIEAWGDINESQLAIPRSETEQAYIELNYCKIEDAITGVLLGERNNLSQIPDKTKSGGLIIANNTSFINNRVAVEFMPYQEYHEYTNYPLPNYSKFTNCHFQITDNLKDQTVLDLLNSGSQVILDKVKYVAFESCHFYTDKTLFEAAKRGTAIFAKETSLRIKNEEASTFEGFTEAILVENTAPDGNTVYINNCEFTDNVHSIVLDAVDNVRLYNNDINVPNSEDNNYISSSNQLERGYDNPVGIYVRASLMNDIRKNDIDGSNPATSLPHSYGIIINSCGGSANQSKHSSKEHFSRAKTNIGFGRIYNNTIDNLTYGIQAEYLNSGDDNGIISNNPNSFLINNGTGEEIKCNIFGNNVLSDIYLTGSMEETNIGAKPIYGELRHQGICQGNYGPAGNTFLSTTNTNIDYGIAKAFEYRKYSNKPIPTHNSGLTIENCTSISTNENTCQDINPCLGVGLPCLLDNIAEIRSDIILIKQNISNTIDNGNTNELISIIKDGNDNDIYSALMDASPFLSDDVLLKLINKSPIINETYFEEIILENCGLSDTVITALENYELSSEVRDNINESISIRSARTQLYEELEYNKYKLNIAQLELINYAIDNLDEQVYSDVLNSFDNNSLSELYKKYSWALYYGNYTDAENTLNLISAIEVTEDLNSSIFEIAQLNFEKETSESFYLSQNQVNELRLNITKDSVSSISERVFLKHYLGENYPRIPVQQNIEYLSANPESDSFKQNITTLNIYPNPATDQITIKLNDKCSGEILVYDMLGSILITENLFNNYWHIINTSKLNPGVYLVVFKESNTNNLLTNKLIIK